MMVESGRSIGPHFSQGFVINSAKQRNYLENILDPVDLQRALTLKIAAKNNLKWIPRFERSVFSWKF